MKRFNIICVAALFIHISMASSAVEIRPKSEKGTRAESQKDFHRTYKLSGKVALDINNQYGNVVVKTWNNRQISVKVTINSNGRSQKESDRIIEKISVRDKKTPDQISVWTDMGFDQTGNYSYSRKGDLKIDYEVYIPQGTALYVSNRIGDVILPDLTGDLHMVLNYGSAKVGRLAGQKVDIRSSYGGTMEIASVKDANVSVKYGNLRIGQAERLSLDLGYGGVSSVGTVKGSGTVNLEFAGKFAVGIGKDCSRLDIKSANSEINLTVSEKVPFTYNANLQYGRLRGDKAVLLKGPGKTAISDLSTYEGYYISESGKCQIKVQGKYTSVVLP